MKKFYLSFVGAAVAFTALAAEPITVDFTPNKMQYMCKPGALPSTDVLVFNITDSDFYPNHSPKEPGWTLALEAVGPLSNTQVNEDPGVPVGKYTVGRGWDENGNYKPFIIRDYSEARQMVNDGTDIYTNHYEINSGEMELVEDEGRYYLSGTFHGMAWNAEDSQELTLNVARTEVEPVYTFFGYPEVENGYEMINPGLIGSYREQYFKNSVKWGEYTLEFYTTPLDNTTTVCGPGAVMNLTLCTELKIGLIPLRWRENTPIWYIFRTISCLSVCAGASCIRLILYSASHRGRA